MHGRTERPSVFEGSSGTLERVSTGALHGGLREALGKCLPCAPVLVTLRSGRHEQPVTLRNERKPPLCETNGNTTSQNSAEFDATKRGADRPNAERPCPWPTGPCNGGARCGARRALAENLTRLVIFRRIFTISDDRLDRFNRFGCHVPGPGIGVGWQLSKCWNKC